MEQTNSKTLPERKFSTGDIVAAVWRNTGTTKDGDQFSFGSVSIERRYKDRDGQWQSTGALRANDIPKAKLVLSMAYDHLVLKRDQP